MKSHVIIETDKTGTYNVYTVDLKNFTIVGEGTTIEAAKADFENAVQETKAEFTQDTMPQELKDAEFVYKCDFRSFFSYFPINLTHFAQFAGINPSLMRQYKSGRYISQKQMNKIKDALHNIGHELVEFEC